MKSSCKIKEKILVLKCIKTTVLLLIMTHYRKYRLMFSKLPKNYKSKFQKHYMKF